MEVSFDQFYGSIRVHRNPCVDHVQLTADLEEFVTEYSKKYDTPPIEIYDAVCNEKTPEWTELCAFQFIKKTVEGQHLLEAVLSEYRISTPLSISPPSMWARGDMNERTSKSSRWGERPSCDINIQAELFDKVDGEAEKYVYTLKLVNLDTDREIYYVGDTTRPHQRLEKHVNRGGDFSYANRNNVEVYEIVSIKQIGRASCRERVYTKV